jgi:hypothetical protein
MVARLIQVQFVDAATGNTFGTTEMPPDQLPATFAVPTRMSIAGQEWEVITAEPVTAAEFTRTGRLVLTLRRHVQPAAQDILYSLPTICDEIPRLIAGSTKQDKTVYEMHEDDWRQVELVARAQQNTIEFQLAGIENIYKSHRVATGQFWAFTNIYVRDQLIHPIVTELPLNDLYARFAPNRAMYEGVAYSSEDGLLAEAFAFKVDDLVVYGQEVGGLVRILGLDPRRSGEPVDEATVNALARLMSDYDLYLVDWCRGAVLSASADDLRDYFSQ